MLASIREEVNARFATGEFIARLLQAAYDDALRREMKHLWESRHGSFKGAHEYRMYVLEKIKLAQRKRYWEDMAAFYAYGGGGHRTRESSPGYDEALGVLVQIEAAERRLAQKRLEIRERIGEIDYAV